MNEHMDEQEHQRLHQEANQMICDLLNRFADEAQLAMHARFNCPESDESPEARRRRDCISQEVHGALAQATGAMEGFLVARGAEALEAYRDRVRSFMNGYVTGLRAGGVPAEQIPAVINQIGATMVEAGTPMAPASQEPIRRSGRPLREVMAGRRHRRRR
jgi:hypothetical protein